MKNLKKEINKMFIPNNEIFEYLKKYIKENASIDTLVARNISTSKNPSIVFEESRNEVQSRSTSFDDTRRILNYTITIYCIQLPNSYQIIQELIILVSEVMEGHYHMKGGLLSIIPTSDSTNRISFQANLRYTIRYMPMYNTLY